MVQKVRKPPKLQVLFVFGWFLAIIFLTRSQLTSTHNCTLAADRCHVLWLLAYQLSLESITWYHMSVPMEGQAGCRVVFPTFSLTIKEFMVVCVALEWSSIALDPLKFWSCQVGFRYSGDMKNQSKFCFLLEWKTVADRKMKHDETFRFPFWKIQKSEAAVEAEATRALALLRHEQALVRGRPRCQRVFSWALVGKFWRTASPDELGLFSRCSFAEGCLSENSLKVWIDQNMRTCLLEASESKYSWLRTGSFSVKLDSSTASLTWSQDFSNVFLESQCFDLKGKQSLGCFTLKKICCSPFPPAAKEPVAHVSTPDQAAGWARFQGGVFLADPNVTVSC